MFKKISSQARQLLTPLLGKFKAVIAPASNQEQISFTFKANDHTAPATLEKLSNSALAVPMLQRKDGAQLKSLVWANRCAFWIPGFALASWTPLIPYVKSSFALGEEHLGLILMCLATGQGLAVVISPWLINFLGCNRTVKVMGLALVAGLLSITLLSNLYLLGLVLICYGWISETVSMAANLNAVTLESYFKRPLLSSMHGVLSLGSVAGVLLVTTMLHMNLPIPLPLLCSAELLSMLVILYCSQIASSNLLNKAELACLSLASKNMQNISNADSTHHLLNSSTPQEVSLKQHRAWENILKNPILWGLGLMCLVIYVTEDSVNDWSGIYLVQDHSLPMHEAGLGFLAFACMMALSRLLGDRLVVKFGRQAVIFGGALLTAGGFILATSGATSLVSICGFALVGLGTANIAPQCISYAASVKSWPTSSIFVVNGVGAIGSLFGPCVIGQLAALTTLRQTFLLIALALVGVAILSLVIVKPLNYAKPATPATTTRVTEQGVESSEFLPRFVVWTSQHLSNYHEASPRQHRHDSRQDLTFKPSEFMACENPLLFWQNLSLQHWTISFEEPPGR